MNIQKERDMGVRRLFIIRKDLNLSAGKLSAMIGHCCEAYWTNLLKANVRKVSINSLPCKDTYFDNKSDRVETIAKLYSHPVLYELSQRAYAAGKDFFYYKETETGQIVEDIEERYMYTCNLSLDSNEYENYINGSFVKTICEAKNLKHLLKVVQVAKEIGLQEGRDFGLINDNCLTELVAENEDGTCTVGIWFKPLDDDIAHELSKKYQLYKG